MSDWVVEPKSGECGKNGNFVKIGDNLQANADEKTRGAPWQAGKFGEFDECGENGKFVFSDILEANANEKRRGAPRKAGEFGEFDECGENGKFVKCGECGKNGKFVNIAANLEANQCK